MPQEGIALSEAVHQFLERIRTPSSAIERRIARCLAAELALHGLVRDLPGNLKIPIPFIRTLSFLFEDEMQGGCETDSFRTTDVATRVTEMIHERFAEPLSIKNIAREVGGSITAVKEAFAATYGCGIHKYLCAVRVREAAIRLRISDAKIESIATDVGFASRKSLNRNFVATFNETPQHYRRRLL